MPARTHARPHPATTGGVDIRLPWWALALPALAFVVLLALIVNPSDAHAASGDPAIARLLERAQQLLAR
jgi:anti-sigma-K factor RskA